MIRAYAPILWNSTASSPLRGRMRFWRFAIRAGVSREAARREIGASIDNAREGNSR